MAPTGVVDGQVADHADAPVVARLDEADQRVVTAEEGVDVVERVGVVAVHGRRREQRRQVQPADPERGDVVEVRLDAGEVATEELVHPRPRRRCLGSSQAIGIAHGGAGRAAPERAKRSGKIW